MTPPLAGPPAAHHRSPAFLVALVRERADDALQDAPKGLQPDEITRPGGPVSQPGSAG